MEESTNRERMESLAQQMSDVLEESEERFIIVSDGEDMAAQVGMSPQTLLGALIVLMNKYPFLKSVIAAALLSMKSTDEDSVMQKEPEAPVQ